MSVLPDKRTEASASGRTARRTRVLLADDSERVMREIEFLLVPDFDIVGKATDGSSLVSEAARLRPDLIVTDLEMPGLSGIEASRAALQLCPGLTILLLTAHGDRNLIQEALDAGIRGYVQKLAAADELISAAYGALRGETFVSPAFR
jgi:DNA-binding NarL/FixJ family response regulator